FRGEGRTYSHVRLCSFGLCRHDASSLRPCRAARTPTGAGGGAFSRRATHPAGPYAGAGLIAGRGGLKRLRHARQSGGNGPETALHSRSAAALVLVIVSQPVRLREAIQAG